MFYDHFNNYLVNLWADTWLFLAFKFWKFYLLKTRFLVIFKFQLEALRVVFWKSGPHYFILDGVYFLPFSWKTNHFRARTRFLEVQIQEMLNIFYPIFRGAMELWSMPYCHLLSVEKYSLCTLFLISIHFWARKRVLEIQNH